MPCAVSTALAFGGKICLWLVSESHKPSWADGCDFAIAFCWQAAWLDLASTLCTLGKYGHGIGESCSFSTPTTDSSMSG